MKKCSAIVKSTLKNALSSKDTVDGFLYYMVEEKYDFKGKEKIRKIAYRSCNNDIKKDSLCSEHIGNKNIIYLDTFENIKCINGPLNINVNKSESAKPETLEKSNLKLIIKKLDKELNKKIDEESDDESDEESSDEESSDEESSDEESSDE